MPKAAESTLINVLLERKGQTFADEAGIDVARNSPDALFQHLCMSMLLSARISYRNALQATRALLDAGLKTPQRMAQATWQERVDVITWHGYKRYDERTSTMLGKTAQQLLDAYQGDLRKLRDEADHSVQQEHRLLQAFDGIGAVGADIFLREVQTVWDEAYPYADKKVLEAAGRVGLPRDPKRLASLAPQRDFPRLTAALIRSRLDKEDAAIREQAAAR
jgi:endonuclease III